jgi:TetR/AcrR family transcriptional regulator, acrAB operon repressor
MPRRKVPSRQEEMSAESQRRLLDAAIRLFAEHGYRETSLQDIGEAAGISRGSVAWHFGSKAGLLEAIVDRTIEQTLAILDAVPNEDVTPLGDWLAFYRDLIQNDPTARLFPMLLFESIAPRSDIRDTYISFHRRIRDWIANRLAVAQARGEIAPDVDIEASAATLWAALVGAHLQWRLDDELDLAPVFATLESWLLVRPSIPAKP